MHKADAGEVHGCSEVFRCYRFYTGGPFSIMLMQSPRSQIETCNFEACVLQQTVTKREHCIFHCSIACKELSYSK